jgi:hypothetical protein
MKEEERRIVYHVVGLVCSETVVDLFSELYEAGNVCIAPVLSTSKTVELKEKVWDMNSVLHSSLHLLFQIFLAPINIQSVTIGNQAKHT